jgi:uncharacterized DUF497 family protein
MASVHTIKSVDITYDAAKNARNIAERGLSFDRAADFDFRGARFAFQERGGELRVVAVGNLDGRLHVLCFTHRGSGIRVISFRKANAREVRIWQKANR